MFHHIFHFGMVLVACWAAMDLLRVDIDKNTAVYYIQYVCGNDGSSPSKFGHSAGPKLSNILRSIFRWKIYWEVTRMQVTLTKGYKTRVCIGARKEVEVELSKSGKRVVSIYDNGILTSCISRPVGTSLTIVGGKIDSNSSWYVVVRRDKPPD